MLSINVLHMGDINTRDWIFVVHLVYKDCTYTYDGLVRTGTVITVTTDILFLILYHNELFSSVLEKHLGRYNR